MMHNERHLNKRLDELDQEADVVFVNCPHFNVQFPNAGIAYLCEAVKGAGYRPAVFDFNIALLHSYKTSGLTEYWEESKSDYLWRRPQGYEEMRAIFDADIQRVADSLAALATPVLAFSVNMMNERCTDDVVSRIRAIAPDKRIVYGGFSYYDLTTAREVSAAPEIMVIGDGEEAIVSVMDALLKGRSVEGVPGVLVNEPGGEERFVQPCFTRPVDEIAWPRWGEFDMEDYTFLYPRLHVPVHPSRGCGWGRCTFCSAAPTNPGYRHRSAENLFEEISYLNQTFGVEGFFLTTLQVNGDYEQLGRLCDLIIASGMTIQPYGQFTIQKKMTKEFCEKLKKAGFIFISFGLESGSNDVLKMMNKGYNTTVASRILKNCHDAEIITSVNLIVGYPGETEEHFQETLAFLEENKRIIDQVEVTPTLNVQFGSDIWANPEKYGIRYEHGKNDWVVNDWVSLDGANTYAMRTERQGRLLDFVRGLGIGRGYAEQGLDFSEGHPKEFDFDLFKAILAPQLDRMMGERGGRVLVMRTSLHEHVQGFLSVLEEVRPDLTIDLLVQASSVNTYAPLLKEDRLVLYDASPFFSRKELGREGMARIIGRGYDTVIFFYGQMTRGSYAEVKGMARELTRRQVVGCDMRGKCEQYFPAPPVLSERLMTHEEAPR